HLRALLLERGIAALSPRVRGLIEDLRAEWRALDKRIAAFDTEFVQMARNDETARRLATISWDRDHQRHCIGGGRRQRKGLSARTRHGGVARADAASGDDRRQTPLLGISKRGNRYLRKNLIHGARAVLPYLVERKTPLGRWARGLLARAHKNVVVVALANKLARIAWAILAHGGAYDAGCDLAAA